ncbi:NAD-binding protein [Candidatus Marsarchaeota archaeon]|jgi:voltage-gated potassium channel|nr:NAD-binding protein [Candidatus Marsarchaeota archaeon]MCL5090152.1 NAD-binding protein [Candidatus Marsarchaeota archaeon]
MQRKEKEMSDHVIICGYGIVGQKVADVLAENGIKFIIIDSDKEKIDEAINNGYTAVLGDATRSNVLKDVSIITAKVIAIVMDNDAKNLFTLLTARDLNKKIFIATRANEDLLREKLIDAGANYVIMPQKSASKEVLKELGIN